MQALPHHYSVTAAAAADGDVTLRSAGIPSLQSSSPVQFDGPGDRWSPETLLVAAVGDCLILTFKAIARAREGRASLPDCQFAEGDRSPPRRRRGGTLRVELITPARLKDRLKGFEDRSSSERFHAPRTRDVYLAGSESVTTVPPAGGVSIVNRPPCASTTRFAIGKPRPVPRLLVVKKGSNAFSLTSGGMPGPLSAIAIAHSPSWWRIEI